MNPPRPSARTLHATTVARDGRAVVITGPSGAGKSDLALRLIDRGFTLVADDQSLIRLVDGRLLASAPPAIAGKIEVRGIGICDLTHVGDVEVALLVELGEPERLPDAGQERPLLGIAVPLARIDAAAASAALKVELALERLALATGPRRPETGGQ